VLPVIAFTIVPLNLMRIIEDLKNYVRRGGVEAVFDGFPADCRHLGNASDLLGILADGPV